jgi:uncharacterized protein YukE
MYGDTAAMRKRAGQLREQGTDVRALADRLVSQVDSLSWTGRAAVDMRARVQDRAALLRDCASAHENAAESLERHLAEVDRLKDSISGIERKAGSLVADDAGLREQFTPPPPGHKAWLTVNLPGL